MGGEIKVDDKLTLPDVSAKAKEMGYSGEESLFEVLFANEYAKSFTSKDPIMQDYDNSEVFGDNRDVIGSDGEVFKGYGFFVQKYLWEEYRKIWFRSWS